MHDDGAVPPRAPSIESAPMRRPLLALLLPLACQNPAPPQAAPAAAPEAPARPAPPPTPTPPTPPPPPELPPITDAMLEAPWFGVDADGCEAVLRLPLTSLAEPFTALAFVARPQDDTGGLPFDCAAPVVAEVPRAVLAAAVEGPRASWAQLELRVGPPAVACPRFVGFGLCLRDRAGGLHPARYSAHPRTTQVVRLPEESWSYDPTLLTPSGPTADAVHVARGWQLVGADTTSGARMRVGVRAVRRGAGPVIELTLSGGSRLELFHAREVWHTEKAAWIKASQVVAGDRLLGLAGPLTVEAATRERADRWDLDISDVDAPDTYVLGGLLIRDGRPTRGEPVPLTAEEAPDHVSDVDIVPAPQSWDCMLRTTTTIRSWPAGAVAIALRSARHPGPPGARVPLACDAEHEAARIPVALWHAWRADPAHATQPLSVMIELDTDACSSGAAAIACAVAADGARTPLMPSARWGLSGAVCFATGTPIDTPAGPVAIEALPPGAAVRSFDVEAGEPRLARVERRASRGVQPVLKVILSSGDPLRVTAEHPLWLPRAGEFRLAGELRPGDRLLGADGVLVRVESVDPDGEAEVWELSVDAPDTYFAGGVLAHNY